MKITTHRATEKDVISILDFMEDYYEIERIEHHKGKSEEAIRFLLEHDAAGSIWIIRYDNVAIGYYCLAYNFSLDIGGRDCFLDEIYIEREYRKKGIGKKVLSLIDGFLKTMDFKGIHLLVYNFNTPAYDFYCKNGFIAQDGKFMTKVL